MEAVFITKYATTTGVFKIEKKDCIAFWESGSGTFSIRRRIEAGQPLYCEFYRKGDWFYTEKEATSNAFNKIEKALALLEKKKAILIEKQLNMVKVIG